MPLYHIHKFVYDTEQSCWKMPQMPRYLGILYGSFCIRFDPTFPCTHCAVVRKIRLTPMILSMIGRGKAGADAEGHVRIALSKVTEVSHTDAKPKWMFA